MIPFHVEESMSNPGHKMITIDEGVFDIIGVAGMKYVGTYHILFARLFGLTYAEFCRFVRDKYNATLHGKNSMYPTFTFADRLNANQFQMELWRRWDEFIKGREI